MNSRWTCNSIDLYSGLDSLRNIGFHHLNITIRDVSRRNKVFNLLEHMRKKNSEHIINLVNEITSLQGLPFLRIVDGRFAVLGEGRQV